MDEYCIEERDDKRTYTGQLVQDCDRKIFSSIPEYVEKFNEMVFACGMVSYYMNMKLYVEQNYKKAEDVADAYQHDKQYYCDQYDKWRDNARKSFKDLSFLAHLLHYEMPERNLILNALTLYKKRRDCYKYYLNTYLKKGKTFSPMELEGKFQNRLKKRLKKKS